MGCALIWSEHDNDSRVLPDAAYYVPIVASFTGTVKEFRFRNVDSGSSTKKMAIYDSTGTRLWYGSWDSGGIGWLSYDQTGTLSVAVTKGQTYYLYICCLSGYVATQATGTDYDVQYTSDLDSGDTPPADLFSGITWSPSSRYNIDIDLYGLLPDGFEIAAGEDNEGSAYGTQNYMYATKFQASISGLARLFKFCIDASAGPGYIKLFVYDDDSGEPGNLLWSRDLRIWGESGEEYVDLGEDLEIVSGDYYWLGFCEDDDELIERYSTSGVSRVKSSYTFSTFEAPDPAPTMSSQTNQFCLALYGVEENGAVNSLLLGGGF